MNPKISHKFVKPYNRAKSKGDLRQIVLDYFNQKQEQQHPLLFCAGLENCFYAEQNCLYEKKRCYCE